MNPEVANVTERRPPARPVGVHAFQSRRSAAETEACPPNKPKLELQRHHAWPEAGAPLIWFGVVMVAAAVLFFFNPGEHSFFPPCLFHQLTGWHCPGCGATRAAHALLRGNLAAAWRDNALLVAALPLCLWLAVRFLGRRRCGRSRALVSRPAWLWVWLVVLAGFAVLRNLPAGAGFAPP